MSSKTFSNENGQHQPTRSYAKLARIDGRHPLRQVVPDGYVDYPAQIRRDGSVFYFNFNLARETGLIASDHPDQLSPILQQLILDTFSLQIVNEYDTEHGVEVSRDDMRKHPYMATRYLQMQHPDKRGLKSGDGRSIWNGYYKAKGKVWDVSSCGTGATKLSPATSNDGQFYKTGDENTCYGSGKAHLWDGMGAVLMSEILNGNGLKTERTLALISFPDGTSVNVRACDNLIRPAHFFMYVKQSDYQGLKGLVDYYIDRQVENDSWPQHAKGRNRYRYFLERVTEDFALMSATLESEYIFCWLEWDGDNILTDGSIIDYGSLRQFGLFHHEYRYDDVERYSTNITEQRNKARYIIQTFAQIADYVETGVKKAVKSFKNHASLRRFDREFETCYDRLVMYKLGFPDDALRRMELDKQSRSVLHDFRKQFHHFERIVSKRRSYKVSDGITRDAVFSMRDILREIPDYYLSHDNLMPDKTFIDIMKSNYASRNDIKLYPARRKRIRHFQLYYQALVLRASELTGKTSKTMLEVMRDRSQLINRYDRVTGDSLIHVSKSMMRNRYNMSDKEWYAMLDTFIGQQILRPEYFEDKSVSADVQLPVKLEKNLDKLQKIVGDYREGL